MLEIRFYHLQRATLEEALPVILAKALQQGRKTVVRCPDDTEGERLSRHLWTYSAGSFLPHGTARDGFAADQPVYLTAGDENPAGADVLILTGGVDTPDCGGYSLCCDLFDGRNPEAHAAARLRWKNCAGAGHFVTYWQQDEGGRWQKNAEANVPATSPPAASTSAASTPADAVPPDAENGNLARSAQQDAAGERD